MRLRNDDAYEAFLRTPEDEDWAGTRIKDERDRPLQPGGRARLTLFDKGEEGGERAHPRFEAIIPPATDPEPPGTLFAPEAPPASGDDVRELIRRALTTHERVLSAADIDVSAVPRASQRYWQNSIRVQRIAHLFAQVRKTVDGWLASGALPSAQRTAALRAIHEVEAEAYATDLHFDDNDTGTYHSYREDKPFVHYLEQLLDSLPEEGSQSLVLLPAEAQHAIRRQRTQLQAHLDHLMRHKYAYSLLEETNIERTLGGFLIDRDSRHIVSEVPDNESLVPRYELLRIAPTPGHPHAGQWVYRDGQGKLRLQDGTVVDVDEAQLRSAPVPTEQLTFRRAPRDPGLRPGIRMDWDGNGYVQAGKIEWISWAGHCDTKAVMEQLGLDLADTPRLEEYRSDSGKTTVYDRDLLLEMISSTLELGSVYQRFDGTGTVVRGKHYFGGARNDSLPDRLQLEGTGQGRHYRWPLGGRHEQFLVKSIQFQDDQGRLVEADMSTVFFRNLPDLEALDFRPNPRFLKTVEGDYNLIDVTGAVLTAHVMVDDFDENTGYPRRKRETTTIDLRPQPEGERFFLGTHMENPAERRLYRVYLDRKNNRIVGELDVYERKDGKWQARALEDGFEQPLASALKCTLSREMRRDHPELYQTLLDIALRQAQNICADTDSQLEVWNGVVTRLNVGKRGENRDARVEHWEIDVAARYGTSRFAYLVRRNEIGDPVDFCPTAGEEANHETWPDFFWQDFPDIGSKAREGSDWLINSTMLERGIVSVSRNSSVQGGLYVHDDHIKNVFEILYTALAGYPHSIVHADKRYGFKDKAAWQKAVATLEARRGKLSFEADTRDT